MAIDTRTRAEAVETPGAPRGGFGWRRLQGTCAAAMVATFAGIMIWQGFEPFFLIFIVPVTIGWALLRLAGRIGVIWLGIVSLALLIMNIPFLPIALSEPASLFDFVPVTIFITSTLLTVAATVPAFRQGRGPDHLSVRAKNLAIVGAGVVIAATAFSAYAVSSFDSVAAQSGDIALVQRDFAFKPGKLEAASGTISVHIKNSDQTLHTFTIEELGVDVAVPPGREVRATFNAQAGSYKFFCKPHAPDMAGELTVK